jgi:hypothetical protein
MMVLMTLLLAMPTTLWAAQVTAVADRDRLTAGDSLQLELRVEGSPDGDPDLSVLEKDWELISRSQSSQMQLINGNFSRNLVVTLSLMPRRTGPLQIPAVCFGADCSAAQTVTVSSQATTGTEAAPLLLEAEAQPQTVVVGAQIILTVRLLHRVSLAQASLSEPTATGVKAEVRQLGKDLGSEINRDGYRYKLIERRYAVFPRQAGQLNIPALQLDAQIDAGASRNDFFGRSLQQVRRTSEALQIQVTEPPPDLGSRSWLPASRLTLEDDWQRHPPTLRVGEPATRTVTIVAEGLPATAIPELQLPVDDSWKSYPDQPSREDAENDQGIVGTLQQKLALVPTRPGILELPAIDLDWYDVTAGAWHHSHLAALKLEVAPAAAGSLGSAVPALTATPIVTPTVPVAEPPSTGNIATEPATDTTAPLLWPTLSLVLGLGWLVTVLLFWQRGQGSHLARKTALTSDEKQTTEQAALKAVLEAADSSDPQGARRALVEWIRLHYPESAGRELNTLKSSGNHALAEAFVELDQYLYSQQQRLWTGEALRTALANSPRKQKRAPADLPSLYPEA